MKNERKQTNRTLEQSGNTWPTYADIAKRNGASQRFIYWDDEPSEEISGLRKSNSGVSKRNERKTK